jgi:LmbE family N-acetylglucosaminyl deacetylase
MKILVFAPHPDDEVLGCGGTILRHVDKGDSVDVCIVTKGVPPIYDNRKEIEEKWPHSLYPEIMKCHQILGVSHTYFLGFPAVMLETVLRYELNAKIAQIIQTSRPDIIFIPHHGDMQKDHQITSEAVMVAVRPKKDRVVQVVYAYETLSETEWNIPGLSTSFFPNVYLNIQSYLSKKIEAVNCYKSQLGSFPNPRSIEAIESLAKYRGSTMGASAAEAFMLIREYRF